MVHDAARPFITKELIETVLEAAKATGAAVCGLPCSDTIKEVDDDSMVQRTVERSRLWNVQTPQIFSTALLREAYQAMAKSGGSFTDDTAVVEQAGYPVQVVFYQEINLKVTTPAGAGAWPRPTLALGDTTSGVGPIIRKHLHDLNNHLTPLLGYAYLLANEFPEDSRNQEIRRRHPGRGRALPDNRRGRSRKSSASSSRARHDRFAFRPGALCTAVGASTCREEKTSRTISSIGTSSTVKSSISRFEIRSRLAATM